MRKTLIVAVVALALVAFVAAPASAQTRVVCVANGFVNHGGGPGGWTWDILGQGTCLDTLQGNFLVAFSGSGTSDTLGLCDGLLVQNLSIEVNYVFTNLRTLAVDTATDTWSAPLTTFPVATPFLIQRDGNFNGAGTIVNRILLNCPPAGNNVATFAFTTTT